MQLRNPLRSLAGVVSGALLWANPMAAGVDPQTTFYLPFDKDATAVTAGGLPDPLPESKLGALVAGVQGQGMALNKSTLLRYAIPGNYDNARGTLAMWFKLESIGDPKQDHLLFNEEGPWDWANDSATFVLWLRQSFYNSILYRFFNKQGHRSNTWLTPADLKNQWHHVIVTWDKDIGDRIYIDGKNYNFVGGGYKAALPNYKRATKQYEAMTIGLRGSDAAVVLDEVKIFNRMLTEPEALQEYYRICPLVFEKSTAVVMAGKDSSFKVVLRNMSGGILQGKAAVRVLDNSGAILAELKDIDIALSAGGRQGVTIPAVFEKEGEYQVVGCFPDTQKNGSGVNVYAIAPSPQRQQEHPELELKLVKSFDCTQTLSPEEFCDDGLSKVVSTSFGDYRETSSQQSLSRFAYRFFVDEAFAPYLAEIEYPNDKDRLMAFWIDTPSNRCSVSLENGVMTGGNLPLSNQFCKLKYIFFPSAKECAIQVMSWPFDYFANPSRGDPISSAACRRIRISKIIQGLPAVQLHNLPASGEQRLIGSDSEDASFIREFGGNGFALSASFEEMRRMLKNRADYMAFVGQNLFAYPLVHYTGAYYPSVIPGIRDRISDHPDYWVDMALARCREKQIKFMPAVLFWHPASLIQAAMDGPDKPGIMRGEDSVLQVSRFGEIGNVGRSGDPTFDILHPLVEKTIFDVTDDILRQYGNHPSFVGLSLWFWPISAQWFYNLDWGYSDRDIAMFEKETGVKVPGAPPDPQRFLKRYTFLVREDQAMREKWLNWRCRKVQQLLMGIYRRVQSVNPSLRLNIETWALWPVRGGCFYQIRDHWSPGDMRSVTDYYRAGGFDFELYKHIPNLYLGTIAHPNLRGGEEAQRWQDFEYAPERNVPLQNDGANAVWFETIRRELDIKPRRARATKLNGFWWEQQALGTSTAIMAPGDFYLEPYANAMADFDPRYIADGAITTTTLGHEDELREFIRAYRTLPAEPFSMFGAVDDPLCARHRKRDDGYYFYLVNREFYPITATLSFATSAPFELLNLPENTKMKVTDKADGKSARAVTVTVKPFRLMAFKAPAAAALVDVAIKVPEDKIAALEQRLAEFRKLHDDFSRIRDSLQMPDSFFLKEFDSISEAIENCWKDKRYSRLRHLLDCYHLRKVRQILQDDSLRDFLVVPPAYRDNFYNAQAVKVPRVQSIPEINSPDWKQGLAPIAFSEVRDINGKYQPKPAEPPVRVSILYDAKEIGFLFECDDAEIGRIVAKKAPRDGDLTMFDDDSVEVFLANSANNIPYYHFVANYGCSKKEHRGQTVKAGSNDRVHYEDPALYNPEWEVATQILKDKWLCRIVIPFQAFDRTPNAGDVWGVNFCRNLRGRTFTFRCDPAKGFHCPDYFARLEFE